MTYAAGGPASRCPSMLWKQPYAAGLVPEFAQAVLDGLVEGTGELPAGVLRVDRAGVNEVGASELVFRRVAGLLRGAISARLRGVEVEGELRALFC